MVQHPSHTFDMDVDIKETLGNEKLVKILLGGENGQLNQITV
jgi:hypothetical protein